MAKFDVLHNTVSGKIGAVICCTRNGGTYIKGAGRKPRQPNTPAQKMTRTVFSHINAIGRFINDAVLKPYTWPKPETMSCLNRMTHINAGSFKGSFDPACLKIFDGPLFNPGIESALIILTPTQASITAGFKPSMGNPGDTAILVVYDEASNLVYYSTGKRQDGTLTAFIAPQGNPPDLSSFHCYLCFSRPPDWRAQIRGEVSRTKYVHATIELQEQGGNN
jgi:hypothetical protein